MSVARRTFDVMRCCLILALCLAACGQKTEFETAGEFEKEMTEQGWAKLGSFGRLKWPARIVDESKARDEISFRAPDGTPHTYPGYTGYELRVIRLHGTDGSKGAMVYRSKEKR
jgi:hypothetical protein